MRFKHNGLRRLYERDDTRRLNPSHVDRIRDVLTLLDAARSPSDLNRPGYRLHPLHGQSTGLWSIRVSRNWRIVFRFESDGEAVDVDLTDYH